MTIRLAAALVVLAVSVGGAAQVRDAARPTPPSAPSGSGSVSGLVVGGDASRTLRAAHVLLIGTTSGVVKVTSTDAQGRFTFSALPPDRYTVAASKPPYVGAVAGATRPGRPGSLVAVADGQRAADVVIRLTPGAAIAGQITDERGQPARSATVILRQWRNQAGERTLVTPAGGGNTRTDDRGQFRFHSLLPGEYLVAAEGVIETVPGRVLTEAEVDAALKGRPGAPSGAASTAPPATSARAMTYAPVYFPGTPREADALPIVVAAGEERSNADIRLERITPARIEGQLLGADRQPLGVTLALQVLAVGSLLSTASTTMASPDGRFALMRPPGSYVLSVMGSGPLAGQFASTRIDVGGSDLLGVELVMRPAFTVSGRLAFEGAAAAPALAGRRVPIRQLGRGAQGLAPVVSTTSATGAFAWTNVTPGRFVLGGPLGFGPTADTMTWTLQSVVVDDRDLTDLPIEINPDAPPRSVVVTYTDRWQGLSGHLQPPSGRAPGDYTLIVFPEDRAYWIAGTRRIATARPGSDGRFLLSGPGPSTLPPGRYVLAAVSDVGPDDVADPAFLAALLPAGISIELGPGEQKVQDVRMAK